MSLFSGATGLDLGLEKSGLTVRVCVDLDRSAYDTARINKPDLPFMLADVTQLSGRSILEYAGLGVDEVDVVCGGPPCQAFSVFGKRAGLQDSRGRLIFDFARIVSDIKPKVFLMENVRGLLSMRVAPESARGSLFARLVEVFESIAYRVDTFVVNAVNYGAPQIRERLIMIANRYNLRCDFPSPTHSDRPTGSQRPFMTLGDAIRGFEDPDPTLMDFSPRKKHYLRMIPPGGNWRSLPEELQRESMGKSYFLKGGRSAYWRRLSFDYPSPTVVTMPNHAGTSMCHPEAIRALTVGECATVQGFPPSWRFIGSPADKYRQVGNAVPVILGEVSGRVVVDLLRKISQLPKGQQSMTHLASTVTHIRPHVRTRQYFKAGTVYRDVPYLSRQNRQAVRQPNLLED